MIYCDQCRLEDVVNVLDLSDGMVNEHGPNGTAPAELVRLVLDKYQTAIDELALEATVAEDRAEVLEAKLDAIGGALKTEFAERKDACNDSECEICIEWYEMITKLQAILETDDD